jgi:hypothetical protein
MSWVSGLTKLRHRQSRLDATTSHEGATSRLIWRTLSTRRGIDPLLAKRGEDASSWGRCCIRVTTGTGETVRKATQACPQSAHPCTHVVRVPTVAPVSPIVRGGMDNPRVRERTPAPTRAVQLVPAPLWRRCIASMIDVTAVVVGITVPSALVAVLAQQSDRLSDLLDR